MQTGLGRSWLRSCQRLALQLEFEPFVLGGIELRLGCGESSAGCGKAGTVAPEEGRVGQLALKCRDLAAERRDAFRQLLQRALLLVAQLGRCPGSAPIRPSGTFPRAGSARGKG